MAEVIFLIALKKKRKESKVVKEREKKKDQAKPNDTLYDF